MIIHQPRALKEHETITAQGLDKGIAHQLELAALESLADSMGLVEMNKYHRIVITVDVEAWKICQCRGNPEETCD